MGIGDSIDWYQYLSCRFPFQVTPIYAVGIGDSIDCYQYLSCRFPFQVTPIYAVGIGDSIDWYQYFCLWETLSAGMKRVAELVGVKESFLAKAVRGRILTKTDAQLKLLGVHKRFYTALVLHDLVHEMPINEVVRKYNCNKGQLQSLQQSAATFAGKNQPFLPFKTMYLLMFFCSVYCKQYGPRSDCS